MKRIISLMLAIVILLGCLPTILALPSSNTPIDKLRIPETAIKMSEGVFSLGTTNVNGKIVQGLLFLRYQQDFAKPAGTPGGKPDKNKDTSDSSLYELMARGVIWKTTEPYVLNPTTTSVTLTTDQVEEIISTSFSTWENPEEDLSFNIFGDRDTNFIEDGADTDAPDGHNEIFFGPISEQNVIAVTIVWGRFTGPPKIREIIEYDMIFDDEDYDWGIVTDEEEIMDLQNIATHEIGHALGLADLYDTAASEQTMYGYADFGEIIKRDLAAGDIAGVKALYG